VLYMAIPSEDYPFMGVRSPPWFSSYC
jgi:hypothetical protein